MHSMEGTVLFVQESRFLLQAANGERHLFILSHTAGVEPQQLPTLQANGDPVRVGYTTAPDLIAHLAKKIDILPKEMRP